MARLFTCADVLEQLEDSNGDVSSGDDSAYEGEGIVGYLPQATSFMPDADELSGTGCYGNTCCTILFLVVWAFYWYMVARHFIALETR